MKILNIMPFVITLRGELGIAIDGTFAASGWRVSDEQFKGVRGNKFSWYGPNGGEYVDDRSIMRRPTEEQVRTKLSNHPNLLKIAKDQGLVEDESCIHGKIAMKRVSKANFTYKVTEMIARQVIVIEDQDLGSMSVTNDIENVILDIANIENINPTQYMIVYKDSDGIWDGFDATTGRFVALCSNSSLEAVKKYISNQLNLS